MAKVWFVRDGYDPTTDAPAYEDLPLEQCIDRLGVEKKHWLHGLDLTLRFGSRNRRPTTVPGPRHAVCEIGEQEASEEVWRAGFYLLDISPKEVAKRLGPSEVG